MSEVKVQIVAARGYPCFRLKWKDPVTGRWHYRTSGVRRTAGRKARAEAERVAGALQAELAAGRYGLDRGVSWQDFRQRYEREVLSGLAANTGVKARTAFDLVERLLPVVSTGRLVEITGERLSYFASRLREQGKAESTIAGYLAHLKAALRWAAAVGLMPAAPKFPRIRRAKGAGADTPMRGRAISEEEFDRMLTQVVKVVGQERAAAWKYFLRGLWLGGWRIQEALELTWDDPAKLRVDLTGKYPVVVIPGECHKSRKDTILPIAPEFAALLAETPESQRRGRVFKLLDSGGKFASRDTAIRVVSAVGRLAGVKVHTCPRTGKVKYATAHDLRRSFATRWAKVLMPTDLMVLMRHTSINTTLRFYVGRNAESTAETLWSIAGRKGASNGATAGATENPNPPQGVANGSVKFDATACEQNSYGVAEAGLEPARGLLPTGF